MPTPSYEPTGAEYTVEPLSGIRQTIGKRMTESKQKAPHFYVTMDIDMAAAMALRSAAQRAAARDGQDLGERPDPEGARRSRCASSRRSTRRGRPRASRIQNQVNIGHAVARENGLVTAVVRDVDKKPLAQIARETRDLVAGRARAR